MGGVVVCCASATQPTFPYRTELSGSGRVSRESSVRGVEIVQPFVLWIQSIQQTGESIPSIGRFQVFDGYHLRLPLCRIVAALDRVATPAGASQIVGVVAPALNDSS